MQLQIVSVDRFGNIMLNLRHTSYRAGRERSGETPFSLEICGRSIQRLLRTYGESEDGEPFALFNSFGYLEVAIRKGSAAVSLGASAGQTAFLAS
jgi:S-adenosylmethionine hydrolase